MASVLTLGEILLRLSPPSRTRFVGSQMYEATYGGSEANVAVALSQYGIHTSFATKLPKHELGDAAIHRLREFGVDTTYVVRGGERIGVYYFENGYSVRPSQVIYDRKNSAITGARIDEFNLDEIFIGRDLFHVSGITLGIGDDSFQLAKAFMQAAVERGVKVSFDFNYRSKLWSTDLARDRFEQVLDYVDIAFASHLDFTNLLGMSTDRHLEETDILSYYDDLYSKVYNKYHFDWIVSSIRTVTSASHNQYQGIAFDGEHTYTSKNYSLDIVDRVGTGDAFTAGFLYSYLTDKNDQYKVEFATASAALKHTIPGDMLIATTEEVHRLCMADSFHVQR